ncbi:MAG: tetratricopeptide repeat protein [Microcystis sp. M179S2]|uniref:O-linked N-acetylglucosamine transferase, SPINDLY family protein n=1 Tax=Microcystis sp. M179S2 TaxID=2771160 RepID=UPI00258DBFE3|nr:tetratricopeptide repeat protein [Microcystis sp. M179S2]MCA2699737.1 tetratricopeptide repeat protein [Microcystis sp. M179S2]
MINSNHQQAIELMLASGDYNQLLLFCQQALAVHPEVTDYYPYLGLAYLLLEQQATAQEIWLFWLLQSESSQDLIMLLKKEIIRNLDCWQFGQAKLIYLQWLELEEIEGDEEIENYALTAINSCLQEVQEAINRREYTLAEDFYLRILSWREQLAYIWHDLGYLYYIINRLTESFNCLARAIELEENQALYHYTMAIVLEKQSRLDTALSAYQKAIDLNANFVDAYNKLGNLFYRLGQLESAEKFYQQGINKQGDFYPFYINLGNVYLVKQAWTEAKNAYKTAQQLAGDRGEISQNLSLWEILQADQQIADIYSGDYFYQRKIYQLALNYYQKLLAIKIEDSNFYLNCAHCHLILKEEKQALEVYKKGIAYHPENIDLHLRLIWLLQNNYPIEVAIQATKSALEYLPDHLSLKLELMRLMPIVYTTQADIMLYRSNYEKRLDNILSNLDLTSTNQQQEAWKSIGLRTNFYLQYQAKNDLELQKKYGELVYKIASVNFPNWVKNLTMPTGKIRLGYISAHLRHHTVAKLFQGWLQWRNREQFEIYCYGIDINNTFDNFTREYQEQSDYFYQFDNLVNMETIAQHILDNQLHILVYLDIGMDARTTQLAGLRLAPVQCVTWGHPITSGLPTIDYFISSELMEPVEGDNHYSEKLIRLSNLGIAYAKPSLPPQRKTRLEMGLAEDKIIYLNCQSLFKYLPENDDIFPRIAKQVPNSQFIFICHRSEFVTHCFQSRLSQAFNRYGLNWQNYGVMMPQLEQNDYFQLNLLADIYLDNLSWSGGNTTLEAIACQLPVVTCPGEFMRGRHSYAILKKLGITETIATDKNHYIEIAIRLGLDNQWRQTIKDYTKMNIDTVFNDRTSVESLERFYQSVVGEGK